MCVVVVASQRRWCCVHVHSHDPVSLSFFFFTLFFWVESGEKCVGRDKANGNLKLKMEFEMDFRLRGLRYLYVEMVDRKSGTNPF